MKLATHRAVLIEGYNPFARTSDEILTEYLRRLALRASPDADEEPGLVEIPWDATWPTAGRAVIRPILGGLAFDRAFCAEDDLCIFLMSSDPLGRWQIIEIY